MAREIRLEPRGFDEQWAANAAEIEQWRSVDHGKARELHDVVPRRQSRRDPRRTGRRPRRIAFTVVAAGLAVGGLLLYLLITLSGIGPPKALTWQPDVRTDAVPVETKREAQRKVNAAPMTLEERQREEDKRVSPRLRSATRKAGLSTASEAAPEAAPGSPEQKEQAWLHFYRPSELCQANEGRGTIACANEFVRAKMEFEQHWAEGRR
jgi:hypothetical protein